METKKINKAIRTKEKRKNLLGVDYSTAMGRLKKQILFRLIQETDKDICFRCNKKIENIDELSIEHKDSWMDAEDPVEAFFSPNNIAFSHLSCNSSAGKKPIKKHTSQKECQKYGYNQWISNPDNYAKKLAYKREWTKNKNMPH